ncbi:MAG: hypothetical protein ACREDT_05075 [Methylocella sp.]
MTIGLTTTVLSGVSTTAPGVDGDGLFGVAAVWADAAHNGAVTMAISGSSPPYAPVVLNQNWTSFDTPAVALASDWEQVFVAFVDYDGYIQLATSGDGWTGTQSLSQGGLDAGPSLAYADNLLYIAWKTPLSQLAFATCDQNGQINFFQSDKLLTSRPTICADDSSRIYVLCGGSVDSGPLPILIYLTLDGGRTFSDVKTRGTSSIGPPSLVNADKFYLAWADGTTSYLRLAETADLGSYTAMDYDNGCHGGGPALLLMLTIPDVSDPRTWIFTLCTGWAIGAPPNDPTAHHVEVGSFGPLVVGAAHLENRRAKVAKLLAPRAPNPCPDPLTIYDPATGKCVPKGGCFGACVLSSFSPLTGLFNPFSYAVCVARCLSHS